MCSLLSTIFVRARTIYTEHHRRPTFSMYSLSTYTNYGHDYLNPTRFARLNKQNLVAFKGYTHTYGADDSEISRTRAPICLISCTRWKRRVFRTHGLFVPFRDALIIDARADRRRDYHRAGAVYYAPGVPPMITARKFIDAYPGLAVGRINTRRRFQHFSTLPTNAASSAPISAKLD